jgi:hypothetical protein
MATGVMLTLGVASVDAAAEKAQPKFLGGREAIVTPPTPPVLYRFNDFAPDYGAPDPFARKAG